ncbi:MAG: hypothetical protein H5T91_02545 [Synergistetes bacterium]|nr:hypothetical protein [Synergistota bacterium]
MGERGVVRKIKFAKRWLEKAEEAYLQGKSDEGFLSLSLAEAEIRALHKGEWERALKLKKSPLRAIFEVCFLTLLLVLVMVSYPHVDDISKATGGFQISASFEHRPSVGAWGKLSFSLNIPYVAFDADCRLGPGLFRGKELNIHIFYVVERRIVKDSIKKEEIKKVSAEESAISVDEMLRLIELGRRELKIYLTGGR